MENWNDLIQYWRKTAKHDYETMQGLFTLKRHCDSLFYGHLVLEKLLKALVVKQTRNYPKPIHNLLILLKDSNVQLSPKDVDFLAEVSKFNIKARYPDYKLAFYKLCTRKYTQDKIKRIDALYEKLCATLKA